MIVTLTESEWVIATHIAHLRQAQNKSAGLPDQRQSKAVDLITINYALELAVAKGLNLYPDLEFMRPGIEDCMYRGWTIDVKTVRFGHMNVRVKGDKRSEFYIGCAHQSDTTFDIAGFITHERMVKQKDQRNENDDGTHYYALPVEILSKISRIDDACDMLENLR